MTRKDGLPCVRCGTSAWYSNGNCIECKKWNNKKWNKNNPKRRKELDQKWRDKNRNKISSRVRAYWEKHGRPCPKCGTKKRYKNGACKKCSDTKVKKWNKENKEKRNQIASKHYYNHPKKGKARSKVRTAVRNKTIPPVSNLLCYNKCGNWADHYHHHKGYDKENWLNVIPLCTKCHGEARRVD